MFESGRSLLPHRQGHGVFGGRQKDLREGQPPAEVSRRLQYGNIDDLVDPPGRSTNEVAELAASIKRVGGGDLGVAPVAFGIAVADEEAHEASRSVGEGRSRVFSI